MSKRNKVQLSIFIVFAPIILNWRTFEQTNEKDTLNQRVAQPFLIRLSFTNIIPHKRNRVQGEPVFSRNLLTIKFSPKKLPVINLKHNK